VRVKALALRQKLKRLGAGHGMYTSLSFPLGRPDA
jgi:hypothetical protein